MTKALILVLALGVLAGVFYFKNLNRFVHPRSLEFYRTGVGKIVFCVKPRAEGFQTYEIRSTACDAPPGYFNLYLHSSEPLSKRLDLLFEGKLKIRPSKNPASFPFSLKVTKSDGEKVALAAVSTDDPDPNLVADLEAQVRAEEQNHILFPGTPITKYRAIVSRAGTEFTYTLEPVAVEGGHVFEVRSGEKILRITLKESGLYEQVDALFRGLLTFKSTADGAGRDSFQLILSSAKGEIPLLNPVILEDRAKDLIPTLTDWVVKSTMAGS